MEVREFICICCPLGCPLRVCIEAGDKGRGCGVEGDGVTVTVTGNTCPKGAEYGKKEILNPVRCVTSTVYVEGGVIPMVSVKTKDDIPKGKIFDCMEEIHRVRVKAPIRIGDVMISDCACTGVPIVATKDVGRA